MIHPQEFMHPEDAKALRELEGIPGFPALVKKVLALGYEHLRWNAAHLMMGYLHTDESTKSIQRKLHPDLLPWNELKTDRVYDYIVVKTTIALHNQACEQLSPINEQAPNQ